MNVRLLAIMSGAFWYRRCSSYHNIEDSLWRD